MKDNGTDLRHIRVYIATANTHKVLINTSRPDIQKKHGTQERKAIMFDKYFSEETRLVPFDKTVTVHNHQAPTSDSARLLKELEEKAVNNIFAHFEINNPFNAAVIYTSSGMDVLLNILHYEARFELNNKSYTVSGKISANEFAKESRFGNNHVLMCVVKELSERISIELVKDVAPELMGTIRTLGPYFTDGLK